MTRKTTIHHAHHNSWVWQWWRQLPARHTHHFSEHQTAEKQKPPPDFHHLSQNNTEQSVESYCNGILGSHLEAMQMQKFGISGTCTGDCTDES